MNPIFIYRISNKLHRMGIPFLPRFFKAINYIVFNCVIPPECTIGHGTQLMHSGLGIIIHPSVTIGRNCNIYNFVVFGGAHDGPGGPQIHISLGDNCNISTGAKILSKEGLLSIGNNCTVAANAVLLHDLPDNSIAAGSPAKIIKYKTIQP